LAQWNYTELPHAFGDEEWLAFRVANCAEFDAALARAYLYRD
jgi:indolepyruvate decarboxylase